MKREIPWPGNQLNDINEFRHDCYYQCHLKNPTDSGWYEKTNECGQACKKALQEYEYEQGKNPCELKLQAPVFWYESYKHFDDVAKSSPKSKTDLIYITLFIIMILLIIVYMMLYIFFPV
jgi:hypothetical protein